MMPMLGEAAQRLIPAVCDVSVTNACNAACGFCSFARDKDVVTERRFIDRAGFGGAMHILHRRGVRYMTFQGGEPLLHPEIDGLVRDAREAGIKPTLITNGWLLPDKVEPILRAGLCNLTVSIDSHSIEMHEQNRGLAGLGARIREGLDRASRQGITTLASVTVNRLVDYARLPGLLADMGFDAVVFSYPRRKPLGSSSLAYNERSELVNFGDEELIGALKAVSALRRRFPVLNPAASISDVLRHVRGEEELFGCVGGHKYFYLDWNLDVWRCEAGEKPRGPVSALSLVPDQRDRCTACTMACYRDTSVLMHAGIAISDAAGEAAAGRIGRAAGLLLRRSVALSVLSVAMEARQIARLALGRAN